ncbi:MAG: Maf family protein [bacterium]
MPIIEFKRELVLATASEARRALVADAGFEFTTQVVDIDESANPGEEVGAYVERLARAKAEAAVPPSLGAVIVAVDTAIGIEGRIIGKPRDETHAREILRTLSGRAHEVASAIAVRDLLSAGLKLEVTRTEVVFSHLTTHAVDWYIRTGEWRGRAGAYAIQGKGSSLIAEVRGCFTNVIGISMPALLRMLSASS